MMTIFEGYGSLLLTGVAMTLAVSLSALVLGMLLAILTTLIELSSFQWLKKIVSGVNSLIRGLPELLVLFGIYFGGSVLLTELLNRPMQVSAFISGVLALALIFASYASQTLRGAFSAIPKGQAEAGKALGLSGCWVFLKILLPQAWRHALPGLSNLWLVLLKDSALVALIGLGDLMNKAQLAASTTHQPLKFYMIAACLFLILTTVSQLVLNRFIRTANKSLQ
ncbi:ABC transporter permease [Candidiatus Paracoxiella cheracis]|uniref:ABC transporter permease n=1 Tax=Candidiatus Paracoxiella cheracis TaxID=3405120 RepID=UPI003BF60626